MTHAQTPAHTTHRPAREQADDNFYKGRDGALIDERLQRRQYGGFHFGAAFFGWLVSTGLGAMLTGVMAAAGTAIAVTTIDPARSVTAQTAATVGLISGALFLLMLAISYFAGGYVAGRMARFDGIRQGLGVWIIGLFVTIALGAMGAAIGSQFNVLQQLNLPHLPVNQGSFTRGGLITSLLAVVVTLTAAVIGGKVGSNYHRKIDATGTVGYTGR